MQRTTEDIDIKINKAVCDLLNLHYTQNRINNLLCVALGLLIVLFIILATTFYSHTRNKNIHNNLEQIQSIIHEQE